MSGASVVIFDCDGVLVDSEIIVNTIYAEELTRLGMPSTLPEVLAEYCGLQEPVMHAKIARRWGRDLPPDFRNLIQSRVFAEYERSLRAVEGVVDILPLTGRSVCVASNSDVEKLSLALRVTGLELFFTPNIFSAAGVARPKPAPDIFLYTAQRMHARPADCLVVEDSVIGVRAARAAGMTIVGFAGGSHCLETHADQLRAAGAQRVFHDMRQLPSIIDEFAPA